MDEYVGVIKAFAGSYAPQNYMICDGQLLLVRNYTALYAVIGTTYGGDGVNNFALPDLRGRSMISAGQGAKLGVNHPLGEANGVESVNITMNNMPAHTHTAQSAVTLNVSNQGANQGTPLIGSALGKMVDQNGDTVNSYIEVAPNVPIAGASVVTTIGIAGGSQPISILPPTLAITYIICVNGYFPPRP